MEDRVAALELEVSELKEELASVTSELARLRRAIAGLRATEARSASASTLGEISEIESERTDSYSVVGGSEYPASGEGSVLDYNTATVGAAPVTPLSEVGSTSLSRPSVVLSWQRREEIADLIGAFLARSLSGTNRGASGRHLNPLQSRLWIVIRDFAGQIYSPARIFRSWSSAKHLVKPNGVDCGDSVFVGLPSERECRRVLQAAGLAWPGVIEA